MSKKKEHNLDRRSLDVIKALVDQYVRDGRPVASHKLVGKSGIDLSSASVRNIMVKLEDHGLIEQVHKFSGRRPTAEGLSIYINSLLRVQPPSDQMVRALGSSLSTESTNTMVASAADWLGETTELVTLVTLPSVGESSITRLEFVKIAHRRVMAVLVTETGEVRNRLLELDVDIESRELEEVAKFYNQHFASMTMDQARIELGGKVSSLQMRIADLLSAMLAKISDDNAQHDVVTSDPQRYYANLALDNDAKQLTNMTNLLRQKETLLKILEQGESSQDVSVFIGIESGIPELSESSVVMAPYRDEDSEVIGVLGIIGPLNMKYSKVLPLVEVTTSQMQDALSKIKKDLN